MKYGHRSSRITLMSFSGGKPWNSFNEGEYTFGGLREALKDARVAAGSPSFFGFGETHVGVCVFPVSWDGHTRVVGKLLPISPPARTNEVAS